jgi:hypothetical protein
MDALSSPLERVRVRPSRQSRSRKSGSHSSAPPHPYRLQRTGEGIRAVWTHTSVEMPAPHDAPARFQLHWVRSSPDTAAAVSEYQYYEFQAVDAPLTDRQIADVRRFSSRATITNTRFVNTYEGCEFGGDPAEWIEKYFEAFLYFANWGTRELAFRFPKQFVDPKLAQLYCQGDSARLRVKGDHVVIKLVSEDEEGSSYRFDDDEADGLLSALLPIRKAVAAGDHRALYLAWLLCLASGDLEDTIQEPPVPAGLGSLTPALKAFADFLRLDDDLIATAAERSPPLDEDTDETALQQWVQSLPDSEKTSLVVSFAQDHRSQFLRAELMRRFRSSRPQTPTPYPGRTVGELRSSSALRAEQRIRRKAETAARARAKRAREAAAAREQFLADLALREEAAWNDVDALIAMKDPREYDKAVQLLGGLSELAERNGQAVTAKDRIKALCKQHLSKQSFVRRVKDAGLTGSR